MQYFYFADRSVFEKPKPGIRFTEKMTGKYKPTKSGDGECDCEFTLTIDSDDVERMIDLDPDHQARISGTVSCPALSKRALTVSSGTLSTFLVTFLFTYYSLSSQKRKRIDQLFSGLLCVMNPHKPVSGLMMYVDTFLHWANFATPNYRLCFTFVFSCSLPSSSCLES